MKKLIFLLLVVNTSEARAQYCYPSDRLVYQSLQGCDNIRKREEVEVVLPGYTERVIREGTGACEKKAACGLAYFVTEKEQCWPQFKTPVTAYGSWKATVESQVITVGYAGQCTENGESVVLYGPKCAPGVERTATVYHPCETAGGPTVWMTPIPTLDPWPGNGDPCWIYFLMGSPCPFNW